MAEVGATLNTGDKLKYEYLADNPTILPDIIGLLYAQWGHREFCSTKEKIEARFRERMQRNGRSHPIYNRRPLSVGTEVSNWN
ncbi:hypothetical protein [Rhizobium leguminosarum]